MRVEKTNSKNISTMRHSKVKATENASEKREILNGSFQSMSKALDKVQNSGLISKDDRIGIELLKAALREKQNELAGINGYERVPDEQLNNFSNYVVQDMEQAQMITISLVALLLIHPPCGAFVLIVFP